MPCSRIEKHQPRGQKDEQSDEQSKQLVEQPPRPVAPKPPWRIGGFARDDLFGHALERLPEGDGDRQRTVAPLAVGGDADVDPKRPQARIVKRAAPTGERPLLENKEGLRGQRATV